MTQTRFRLKGRSKQLFSKWAEMSKKSSDVAGSGAYSIRPRVCEQSSSPSDTKGVVRISVPIRFDSLTRDHLTPGTRPSLCVCPMVSLTARRLCKYTLAWKVSQFFLNGHFRAALFVCKSVRKATESFKLCWMMSKFVYQRKEKQLVRILVTTILFSCFLCVKESLATFASRHNRSIE